MCMRVFNKQLFSKLHYVNRYNNKHDTIMTYLSYMAINTIYKQ